MENRATLIKFRESGRLVGQCVKDVFRVGSDAVPKYDSEEPSKSIGSRSIKPRKFNVKRKIPARSWRISEEQSEEVPALHRERIECKLVFLHRRQHAPVTAVKRATAAYEIK
jgi:hypothetical protein